jgi:hypothetical protein
MPDDLKETVFRKKIEWGTIQCTGLGRMKYTFYFFAILTKCSLQMRRIRPKREKAFPLD